MANDGSTVIINDDASSGPRSSSSFLQPVHPPNPPPPSTVTHGPTRQGSVMMKSFLISTLLVASSVLATKPQGRPAKPLPPPLVDENFNSKVEKRAATSGSGFFEQLLDHSDPSKGTFSQAYWWSSEYWTGPGAPVVFFTPGESAAAGYTGYLTNRTITGLFAQAIGGATILMEHRYWGNSSPYSVLTTENLTYLTLENAIADTTYFANNVQLPFDTNGSSNAQNAPWVMAGGSYSGALTAWVASVDPGTYWAYYATSAVVQAIDDFVSVASQNTKKKKLRLTWVTL